MIVICASGQRCADVLRLLQEYRPEETKGHTAKLFAKHLKLPDQIKRLKKGDIVLGVGTPHRIAKLMEQGCLQPSAVVMDFNFRNSKKQRMIDEKGVKGIYS